MPTKKGENTFRCLDESSCIDAFFRDRNIGVGLSSQDMFSIDSRDWNKGSGNVAIKGTCYLP